MKHTYQVGFRWVRNLKAALKHARSGAYPIYRVSNIGYRNETLQLHQNRLRPVRRSGGWVTRWLQDRGDRLQKLAMETTPLLGTTETEQGK